MKIAATKRLEIGYEEFGDPTGLPVLLLHGFPDDPLRAWDGVIRQLRHERVRMITPYLRGFGPTLITAPEAVSGQLAALGQDVLDLADALHIERFVIVGQDWGARAAYAAAALAPARIISLLCLATPYVMFGGKDESPAQARAFWYQWYFNSDRGECGPPGGSFRRQSSPRLQPPGQTLSSLMWSFTTTGTGMATRRGAGCIQHSRRRWMRSQSSECRRSSRAGRRMRVTSRSPRWVRSGGSPTGMKEWK